jgi:hypothetical protein
LRDAATATTISFLKHLCAGCSDDVVRSRAIDKELRAEERKAAREVKLLLLGAYCRARPVPGAFVLTEACAALEKAPARAGNPPS